MCDCVCVESGDCPILEEPRYDSSTNNREKESEGKNHVCSTLCVSVLPVSLCVCGVYLKKNERL